MRKHPIHNWPEDLTAVEGLRFFAEIWAEMLFDYTLDSYKLRTFNLLGLCEEFLDAFEQCEAGVLHWKSIEPLRLELQWHLQHDGIARRTLGTSLRDIEQRISAWTHEAGGRDLSHVCSFILKELQNSYFDELRSELAKLVEQPREKKKIRHVSSALLTEMVRRGFAPQFINHRLHKFFFKDHPINQPTDILHFFDRFVEPLKRFIVVARSPARGDLFAVGTKSEFIAYNKQLMAQLPQVPAVQEFRDAAAGVDGYLVFSNVDAMDPYSARRVAGDRLEMVSSVLRFYRHQLDEESCLEEKWLVVEQDRASSAFSDAYLIPAQRNVSFRRPDVSDGNLAKSLNELLRPFLDGRCEKRTLDQLEAALNAHSAAVKSNLPDNRFMNFWRAFETLSGSTSDRDTIQTIMRFSVPILCRKYFLKHVRMAVKSLFRNVPKAWKEALKLRREEESKPEFLARLLTSTSVEAEKDTLFAACSAHVLLRNRLVVIQEMLSSKAVAKDCLRDHENRVRWHIQRMYRVRNGLVHGSRKYRWLDLLCENLHDYFDHFFSEIAKTIADQQHYRTIEMVCFDAELRYASYQAKLDAIKDGTPKDIIAQTVLFGGC
jgi:hypothetical protein